MEKIGLVVGETSSLPKEIIEKNKFFFVPYVVEWEGGEEIEGENIFQKMKNAEKKGIKTFPKTSQPSPFVFKKVFEEALAQYQKIICVTLSSKLSGAFNSALVAKEMMKEKEKIFVLDSLNVTVGEGLIDLKIFQLIQEGKKIEEILSEFKKITKNTYLFGMVASPKYLEVGGRISHSLAVLLEKLQKIGFRPLLGIKEGQVKPIALKMRARDIAHSLFNELQKRIKKEKEREKIKVAIGHGDNLIEAQKLKEKIENKLKLEVLFINLIDPIIGVHVGPDALALAFLKF